MFSSLGVLSIIFALSFLTESLTEYVFGTPLDKLGWAKFKWGLMYVSLALGVGLAFFYQFDLIWLLSQVVGESISPSWPGFVLTGLGIGRGANWLHQFVERYFPNDKR